MVKQYNNHIIIVSFKTYLMKAAYVNLKGTEKSLQPLEKGCLALVLLH